jgi:lysophospholipid acyltransferase (LPLAT)-like uncharacterized protein
VNGGTAAPDRRPRRAAAARDAAAARESAFRRHWTLRDRIVVATAAGAIGLVTRALYATLRVRCLDPHGILPARLRGEHVVWATWHDGIVLLPLVLSHVEPRLRPRVVLSWHRDAEIAAQAVRRFGVAVTRGSATRGWLGAVRGLLEADARGEDLIVIPDGPRGPRHQAKEGVVQLARATGHPVVAVGIACLPGLRLRTWDRLQVPRPFGRVAFVLSAPVPITRGGGSLAAVQRALEEVAEAARMAVEPPAA